MKIKHANHNASPLQVISVFPSCAKDDYQGTVKTTEEIGKAFYQTNGAHLMNFCTDGDSTRRQVYNSLMKYEVPIDSDVGKIIHELPFVDSLAGKTRDCFI